MGFVEILLLVIKYGPALFTMVQEIIEMIKNLNDDNEVKAARAELEDAVKDYKRTKDRKRLRALRAKLRKKCDGDDCAV